MKLSRPQKAGVLLVVFFMLYTITGFFVLPIILKSVVPQKLSDALGREASIGKIYINPFALSLEIEDFKIIQKNEKKDFIFFKQLYFNAEIVSLFKQALIIKEVKLNSPHIFLTRVDEKNFNFSDILKKYKVNEPQAKSSQTKDSKGLRFSVNNIQMTNGRVLLEDRVKKKTHDLSGMEFGIPFLSNLDYQLDTFTEPHFSAALNTWTIEVNGMTKPFKDSMETVLNLDLKDIDLAYYFEYVPVKLNFKLPTGKLDLGLRLAFTQGGGKNPEVKLSGNIDLKNVSIIDLKEKEVLSLPQLKLTLAESEPLKQNINIQKIMINGFEANILREKDGAINLAKLIPKIDNEKKDEEVKDEEVKVPENSTPLKLTLSNFEFSNGIVRFSDLSLKETFKTRAENISISINDFSTAKDINAGFDFSADTGFGERVTAKGVFCVNPLFSEGNAGIEKIITGNYEQYYSPFIDFEIKNKDLALGTGYRFANNNVFIKDLYCKLKGLELTAPGEDSPVVSVPEFSITNTSADITRQEIIIGNIDTTAGKFNIARDKNGLFNFQKLVPVAEPDAAESGVSESGVSESDADADTPGQENAGGEEAQGAQWVVKLAKASVEDYSIAFSDGSTPEPVNLSIDNIKITGENISTAQKEEATIDFSAALSKGGSIKAKCLLVLDPLIAKVDYDLNSIALNWLHPYYMDKLELRVTEGDVSAKGNVKAEMDKGVDVSVSGNVEVNNFKVIGKTKDEKLVKWEKFAIKGFDFTSAPSGINIDKIVLTKPETSLVVKEDGVVNLSTLVIKKDEAGEAVEEKPKQKPDEQKEAILVSVGSAAIESGRAVFVDKSVQPWYATELSDIQLSIKDLDSRTMKSGDMVFKCRLNNSFPFEVKGKLNPVSEKLFVDLGIKLSDMDLSPLTPYSGKYLGQAIEKGKLTLDLDYFIENKNLDAKNKVFIDQFTFGSDVESEDSIDLPVNLAVSLLKDIDGAISLDLPVAGNLDDPEFSIFGVVLTMLKNILVKAATSPFSLISGIVGSGEELNLVRFDHGVDVLTDKAKGRLDLLSKALVERPELKVELAGFSKPEEDKRAMEELRFQEIIKAEKQKNLPEKDSDPSKIEILPEEYGDLLWEAYKSGDFKKAKNRLGMTRHLPDEEMEKVLRKHVETTGEDLRSLTRQRTKNVRSYLLEAGGVEAGRVFLVEPKDVSEAKENLEESHVEISLK